MEPVRLLEITARAPTLATTAVIGIVFNNVKIAPTLIALVNVVNPIPYLEIVQTSRSQLAWHMII